MKNIIIAATLIFIVGYSVVVGAKRASESVPATRDLPVLPEFDNLSGEASLSDIDKALQMAMKGIEAHQEDLAQIHFSKVPPILGIDYINYVEHLKVTRGRFVKLYSDYQKTDKVEIKEDLTSRMILNYREFIETYSKLLGVNFQIISSSQESPYDTQLKEAEEKDIRGLNEAQVTLLNDLESKKEGIANLDFIRVSPVNAIKYRSQIDELERSRNHFVKVLETWETAKKEDLKQNLAKRLIQAHKKFLHQYTQLTSLIFTISNERSFNN